MTLGALVTQLQRHLEAYGPETPVFLNLRGTDRPYVDTIADVDPPELPGDGVNLIGTTVYAPRQKVGG